MWLPIPVICGHFGTFPEKILRILRPHRVTNPSGFTARTYLREAL